MFFVKNSKLFLLGLIVFITADVVAMRPLGSQKGVSIGRQKAMIEALKGAGIDPLTGKPRSGPLKAEVSPLSGDRFGSPALKPRSFPTKQGIDARKVMLQGLRGRTIDPLTACKQDELFIQEEAESLQGICVSSDIIKLSTTLGDMLEDLQKHSKENRAIFNFPLDVMEDTFDILKVYSQAKQLLKTEMEIGALIEEKMKRYPLHQLIGIANFIDFLDCPENILNNILYEISNCIRDEDKDFEKFLTSKAELNPDLKELFVDFVIQCLKNKIIRERVSSRKINLPTKIGSTVSTAAFSPDGKSIVSTSYYEGKDDLIIWDISNIEKITHKSIQSNMIFDETVFSSDGKKIISRIRRDLDNPNVKNILSIWDTSDESNITKIPLGVDPSFSIIALSSDGKRIVSNKGNEVIVSDITDMNNITHQEFPKVDPGRIEMAVFSSDGKKIVFVSRNNGLRSASVYDISNMNEIKYGKLIENDPDSEFVVAFSPDGERIVSGSNGTEKMQHSLIVWDISDINNIMDKVFAEDTETLGFSAIAFSPDGKKIVSGILLTDYLVVWDISDMKNITHQAFSFSARKGRIDLVAFSPDGKSILTREAFSQQITVFMLLTDKEEAVLNQLKKCDFRQISLIYRLYSKSESGSIQSLQPNSPEGTVFKTLPTDVQQLLSNLFWLNWPISSKEEQQATGWFSAFRNWFK